MPSSFPHAHAGLKHLFTSTILEVASFIILTYGSILTILSEIIETTTLDLGELPVGIRGVAGVEAGEIILIIGIVLHGFSAILHIIGLKHASEDHRFFRYGLFFVAVSFCTMILAELSGQANESLKDILERVESIADIISICFVCKGIEEVTTNVGRVDVAHEKLGTVCLVFVVLALVEEIIGMILPRTVLWRTMLSLLLRVLGYILYMVYIYAGYTALAPKEE